MKLLRNSIFIVLAVSVGCAGLLTSWDAWWGDASAKGCKMATDVIDVRNDLNSIDYSQVSNPEVIKFLNNLKELSNASYVVIAQSLLCSGTPPPAAGIQKMKVVR